MTTSTLIFGLTPFSFSGILAGIPCAVCGLLVFLSSRNRKMARTWFLFSFAVCGWEFGAAWIGSTQSPAEGFLAWRVAYGLGVCWIAVTFYHFVNNFLDRKWHRFILIHYVIASLFWITIPTRLFWSHAPKAFDSFYYALGGPIYPLFFAWWMGLVVYSHYQMIVAYPKVSQQKKNQIKYFLFALALAYSGGSLAYLPNFGIYIYPWGNFTVFMYPVIMSYAIVKHGLMDIELLIREAITSIFTAAIPICPFAVTAYVWRGAWQASLLVGIGMILVARFYRDLHDWVEVWVDRFLFGDRYSYLKGFQRMAREDRPIASLKEFLAALASEVVAKAQVRSCTILILLEELASRPRFQTTAWRDADGRICPGPELQERDALALMRAMNLQAGVLLREQDMALNAMDPSLFQVAVPLRVSGRIFGLIAVGPKTGKARTFNTKDLKALLALADAIAAGVWARLEHYEQTMRVETGLHDAMNYFNMLGMAYQTKGLEKQGAQSLAQGQELLQDMRFFNQMAMSRQLGLKKELQSVNVVAVLEEVVKAQQNLCQGRGLTLELKVPESIPPVPGDPPLMKRCIGNLVANAAKLSTLGAILVSARLAEGQGVEISVTGSDLQIPAEALSHMFDPYYRVPGKEALGEGAGLGLAIVKEYMLSVGGGVRVESDKNKGTCFYCWIPVPNPDKQASEAA